MKIGEFCREPGYGSAVLLTWSFDAVYFERVILQAMLTGDSRVPLVVADRRQIAAAMDRWSGQLQHLGRRYALDTATPTGDFHPKLILRLGPKGGLVWLTTGNVSAAGFGGNRELAATWRVGPTEPDTGAWVPSLLDQVEGWCTSVAAKEVLARARSEPWIAAAPSAQPAIAPIIWAHPGATLAQQLEERWRGRRFDEVRLTSGSTDSSGEFLSWAHKTFGIRRAIVAVHASAATFEVAKIERLPLDVRFIEPSHQKPLHAKSYWFDGPDGSAAVFGSANCSASAWLRPVASGGNIETIAVFDSAEKAAWRHVLAITDGNPVAAAEHLRHRAISGDAPIEEQRPEYCLMSVELDRAEGYVRARVTPAVPSHAAVSLELGDDSVTLVESDDATRSAWNGPLPESAGSPQALFATMRIETSERSFTTPPRWVDQKHDLRDATHDHRAESALRGFSSWLNSNEQRQMLEDLQLAMDTVLSDRAGFPDMPLRAKRTPARLDEAETTRRLDPQRVAVELGEQATPGVGAGPGNQSFPMSFGGVLRAFFPESESELPLSDETPDLGGEEGTVSQGRSAAVEPPVRTPPTDLSKHRLIKKMDAYLQRLREPVFANTCTATQLVQAVAFPMAIATLGAESGWVALDHARDWTLSAVMALLHERIPESAHKGLLGHVAARYAADGRTETFERVVGDGLLWTVSAAVLAGLKWEGLGERVQRALFLRDVFQHGELVAKTEVAALRYASGRLRHRDAVKTIAEELPRIVALMTGLEKWLAANFAKLVVEQATAQGTHEAGDPLWRPGVGWVFATDQGPLGPTTNLMIRPWHPRQLSSGDAIIRVRPATFYVNVRIAVAASQGTAPSLP